MIKTQFYRDSGTKLFLDNNAIIDSWNVCNSSNNRCSRETNIYLEGGRWYPIKIEFFLHTSDYTYYHVLWRKPGDSSLEVIPATNFRTEKVK
ncbi:MAG: hypothetical protein IMF12_02750 [Proteobacteria bacterium]|nr:hypothetical protein [Pseudomonadota bacterium]